MHRKSGNIKIIINDKTDEVVKELFDSLKNRDHNNFESIKGSKFVLDYVRLLYYKCYKRIRIMVDHTYILFSG